MVYFSKDLNRNSSVNTVLRLRAGMFLVRISEGATNSSVLRNVRLHSGFEYIGLTKNVLRVRRKTVLLLTCHIVGTFLGHGHVP